MKVILNDLIIIVLLQINSITLNKYFFKVFIFIISSGGFKIESINNRIYLHICFKILYVLLDGSQFMKFLFCKCIVILLQDKS